MRVLDQYHFHSFQEVQDSLYPYSKLMMYVIFMMHLFFTFLFHFIFILSEIIGHSFGSRSPFLIVPGVVYPCTFLSCNLERLEDPRKFSPPSFGSWTPDDPRPRIGSAHIHWGIASPFATQGYPPAAPPISGHHPNPVVWSPILWHSGFLAPHYMMLLHATPVWAP